MKPSYRERRSSVRLGALVKVIVGLAVLQLAGAASASAVSGLQTVAQASGSDLQPRKTVTATCPPGKRVIGGGGFIQEDGFFDVGRPVLTQLRPVHPNHGRDAYVVSGARTQVGFFGEKWQIGAYAVCASPFGGVHIVPARTDPSFSLVQATAAVCPGDERVIGSGARVSSLEGDVVLQVARPSTPGDIVRAQGHLKLFGQPRTWRVTAYAICVRRSALKNYRVVFTRSKERDSETRKEAFAACQPGQHLLSSGAAVTNVGPGSVSLQGIWPDTGSISPNVDTAATQAVAVENVPWPVGWDFIVATAICAS